MSGLRRKMGHIASRFRRVRRRKYMLRLYNQQRQIYYAKSSRKIIKSTLKVSIVVPCYNPPVNYFEELLSSVLAQSHENWELVLADGSTDARISSYIERKASADKRIVYLKVFNKGIASTTNEGIDAASGDLIAFLDHDDTLDPDALAYAVEQFEEHAEIELVYSDEDKLSSDGSRYLDPHFKPDFSLDLLRNVNYITHFVVVRADLVRRLEGIRLGFDGAQDYDFLLRAVDTGAKISHVARILYHWRLSDNSTASDFSNKKHITDAGAKALNEHYKRNSIDNVIAKAIKNRPGFYTAKFTLRRAQRAVVVLLDKNISGSIRQFIVGKYSANKSLRANDVDILTPTTLNGLDLSKYESVMFVRDLVVPGYGKSPIAQLFAVAEQQGVYAVSPKAVADGKVVDMGLVNADDRSSLIQLFSGMEDTAVNFFGSVEWVRNVNALSGKVFVMPGSTAVAYLENPTNVIRSHGGRLVVWSHIELLSLCGVNQTSDEPPAQDRYYNGNLSYDFVPITRHGVPVTSQMEEKEYSDNDDDES